MNFEFNGVVENVVYDIKGTPKITVNEKEYYLGVNINFKYLIQKGDKINKNKWEKAVKLVKQNLQVIIFD